MTGGRRGDVLPDCSSDDLPLDRLCYTLTPTIARSMAFAHRYAGEISATRFSYYGLQRLEAQTERARIVTLCAAAGHPAQIDEVAHVVAGDILPPRRRVARDVIRRAAILVDAVGQYGERREASTPQVCAAYFDLAARGDETRTTSWAKSAGRERARLLESHRDSVKTDPRIEKLYSWLSGDEFLACEPLLRAAILYWALSELPTRGIACMGIDAVLAHELRAGRLGGQVHGHEDLLGDGLVFDQGDEAQGSLAFRAQVAAHPQGAGRGAGIAPPRRGRGACGTVSESRHGNPGRVPEPSWPLTRPPRGPARSWPSTRSSARRAAAATAACSGTPSGRDGRPWIGHGEVHDGAQRLDGGQAPARTAARAEPGAGGLCLRPRAGQVAAPAAPGARARSSQEVPGTSIGGASIGAPPSGREPGRPHRSGS